MKSELSELSHRPTPTVNRRFWASDIRKNWNCRPKNENQRKMVQSIISKYSNTKEDPYKIKFFALGSEVLWGDIRFLDFSHITVKKMWNNAKTIISLTFLQLQIAQACLVNFLWIVSSCHTSCLFSASETMKNRKNWKLKIQGKVNLNFLIGPYKISYYFMEFLSQWLT
jgi:hypothetical protein